ALETISLDVSGMRVLDVGISTGGFSHCLLQKGAREVIGIDVGHKQIHPSLLNIESLFVFEGVNVRELSKDFFKKLKVSHQFDLVVGDVSFISLKNVMPHVAPLLGEAGLALFLVKPQFELEKKDLGKGGIVRE